MCAYGYFGGSTVEGRPPNQQLIQDGSHAPEVRFGIILLELQYLGRHIQRRATQRFRKPCRLQIAGKSEVCDLQQGSSTRGAQQQVLGFEIPLRQQNEGLGPERVMHAVH